MPTKKTKSSKPAAKTTTKKKASPKKRAASTKAKSKKAGEQEVTIDRRTKADRRDESETEASPAAERRTKVQRRRQIDPTTCERDYSESEVEFMNAMDEYKRTSGRMFPTCSEVLEVIRSLGYVKLSPAELAVVRPEVEEANGESPAEGDEEFSDELETMSAGEGLY